MVTALAKRLGTSASAVTAALQAMARYEVGDWSEVLRDPKDTAPTRRYPSKAGGTG